MVGAEKSLSVKGGSPAGTSFTIRVIVVGAASAISSMKSWALAQTLAGLRLQIVHDLLPQIPEITDLLPDMHIAADALRINNFVTAHQNLGEILRQWLAASEQINYEHAFADFAAAFDHQFQRRIADDAGVPIMFAPDGGPGECCGQAAAGEDVIHGDVINAAVENLKLRCLDIDCAHQQADWTFSEAAEIHILL